ncbi:MAG: septal ring lytic transglycosylase RlpA family protein [Ignavibacteria bacterium]|nr:septal ring lytic transglycosylase RlpA family protein [Ignavibacteria bacterium]MBI3766051.1 septal ring lytic transglycosylase RlpA family protein [Ignavibacteriales bacterium]
MSAVYRNIGIIAMACSIIGCVSSPRFTSAKHTPDTDGAFSMNEEGVASYYAEEFNGRKTSNGETYDMNQMTAAHRTLPFNSHVRVINTSTGKSVVVRINDRGPFKDNRIIDLSLAAAKTLELIGSGTANVRLEVIDLGDTTLMRKP